MLWCLWRGLSFIKGVSLASEGNYGALFKPNLPLGQGKGTRVRYFANLEESSTFEKK
ncbi:hypothetical protein PAENIP36_56830 [Paenibacillus sp. P36]